MSAMSTSYLDGLNPAQMQAVTHPPHVPLQILAGPGSGKTRVLTCRIVHFIKHHKLQPSSLCAVTFTNKAAGEMRTRLEKLIGKGKTDQIRMGTFHSLCAKFLRRHADKVGIRGNFTICDAEESKKLFKKSLKQYAESFAAMDCSVPNESTISSKISQAKAQGLTPRDLLKKVPSKPINYKDFLARTIAEIYAEYQDTLRKSNSLDFDDLLVKGVHLFRDNPEVATWCKHILVDEFQDTNTVQYELMKVIAAANKCVTIVGDPDQSIYGWRSAEVENIRKMTRDFSSVAQVLLEQNYRSTGAILASSVAIVAEDKARMPKTLFTSHAAGSRPLLFGFKHGRDEALFIAVEVKRLVAYTGGMLKYDDFAILLRYNSLSRALERELQKEGIPHRVLGGRKFFERIEIKDLLAYLQLVDNPQYAPAFIRVINVPPRAIGPKTVEQILSRAAQLKISPMEVAERIYTGNIPDTKPPAKNKLAEFVEAIQLLRERAEQYCSPSVLIPKLVQIINYEEHLKKTHKDHEERLMNVEELMNFAAETETLGSNKVDEGPMSSQDDPMDDTPLRLFLQASMLSTDADAAEDDKSPKLTIATCHAAKGLEWPVVFVPAVELGVFPAARATDMEEERRLLYVACTRAQNYLTLLHCESRLVHGQEMPCELSGFITCLEERRETLFTDQIPKVDDEARQLVATILGRTCPNEVVVARKIHEYKEERRRKTQSYSTFSDQWADVEDDSAPRVEIPEPAHQGPAAFTTAAATLRSGEHIPARLLANHGPARAPLVSSSDHVVNGATRAQARLRKSAVTVPKLESQAIIDLRSPSPELPQPRPHKVDSYFSLVQKAKSTSSSNALASGSSGSASGMVIDLRSPSPEVDSKSAILTRGAEPARTINDLRKGAVIGSSSKPSSFDSKISPLQVVDAKAAPSITARKETTAQMPAHPSASLATAGSGPSTTTRKRLGMGRTAVGYPNKKFKAPA